jgi:hypothetical protein
MPRWSWFTAATNPPGATTCRMPSIGDFSPAFASTAATSVWPAFKVTAKPSTSPALASRPFTTTAPPTGCACPGSSFGSVSTTSGSVPTTNGRIGLAPSALWARSQYTPGAASAAAATVNFPLSFAGVTVSPGRLTHTFAGHGSNAPAAETSTVVPRCAPAGNR